MCVFISSWAIVDHFMTRGVVRTMEDFTEFLLWNKSKLCSIKECPKSSRNVERALSVSYAATYKKKGRNAYCPNYVQQMTNEVREVL